MILEAAIMAGDEAGIHVGMICCEDSGSAMDLAVSSGRVESVKCLVEHFGCDPERGALHTAARYGHVAVARYLLNECDVNPNARNGYGQAPPIYYAIRGGHVDFVKMWVVECGVDSVTIYSAVTDGTGPDMAMLMVGSYRPIDHGTYDLALSCASSRGYFDLARRMIEECGVNPLGRLPSGWSILHDAAIGDNPDLIRYLVDVCGEDPDVTDNYGRTPLFYSGVSATMALVSAGASTDIIDESGNTPLSDARCIDEVEALLICGAHPCPEDVAKTFRAEKRGLIELWLHGQHPVQLAWAETKRQMMVHLVVPEIASLVASYIVTL